MFGVPSRLSSFLGALIRFGDLEMSGGYRYVSCRLHSSRFREMRTGEPVSTVDVVSVDPEQAIAAATKLSSAQISSKPNSCFDNVDVSVSREWTSKACFVF